MKITASQYASALYGALQETRASDADRVLDNFVTVLKQNGQLGMFEAIAEEFQKCENRARGEITAEVTFAREGQSEKAVLDRLNQVIGKNLEVKKKIDSGLLGGVVVETEDIRIDASLKKQLDRLKDKLSN